MIYLTNFCSALNGDGNGEELGWFGKLISKLYTDGVEKFIDFAFENVVGEARIYYPCKNCRIFRFKGSCKRPYHYKWFLVKVLKLDIA